MKRLLGLLAATAVATFAMSIAARAARLVLSSPSIIEGGIVPNAHVYSGYGYKGGNTSPALSWTGAPSGTKSFALTMSDPDAPHAGGWWHWLVFDIPANVDGVPENAGSGQGLPDAAVQSLTDFGTPGYGGPAPPPGKPHRYVFTLHALKVERLAVSPSDPPAKINDAIRKAVLAEAVITAKFGK